VTNRLSNPYAGCGTGPGAWVRGNLHGHSSEHSGCSSVPLAEGIRRYRAAGAGFLAVTDHDHVSDLAEARASHPDMVFLEGFEHSAAENVLFVGERVPPLHRLPLAESLAAADGLLTVVCHPRPRGNDDYWTVEKILALSPPPVGIEVYNGHYGRPHVLWKNTNPLYTDTWDGLLSRGARMWGYANDDFHDPPDFGRAWNMVWVDSPTPSGLMRALASGRCYGTTGLLAESIAVEDSRVVVRLTDSAEGRFVGPQGRVLSRSAGRDFAGHHDGEAYVRFEAQGEAGMLWLQPFFRRHLDTNG
jgi:hypothetical protein